MSIAPSRVRPHPTPQYHFFFPSPYNANLGYPGRALTPVRYHVWVPRLEWPAGGSLGVLEPRRPALLRAAVVQVPNLIAQGCKYQIWYLPGAFTQEARRRVGNRVPGGCFSKVDTHQGPITRYPGLSHGACMYVHACTGIGTTRPYRPYLQGEISGELRHIPAFSSQGPWKRVPGISLH